MRRGDCWQGRREPENLRKSESESECEVCDEQEVWFVSHLPIISSPLGHSPPQLLRNFHPLPLLELLLRLRRLELLPQLVNFLVSRPGGFEALLAAEVGWLEGEGQAGWAGHRCGFPLSCGVEVSWIVIGL